VAVQSDPYLALPSLYGAPAYSRPRRPAGPDDRPPDPDDLPLATHQTEEERSIARALLAPRQLTPNTERTGHGPAGAGDPDSPASAIDGHDRTHRQAPRRMSFRG